MSFGFYPSYYKRVCSSRRVTEPPCLSERHYLCVECNKEFSLPNTLIKHVYSHHKSELRKEDNPVNAPESSKQEPPAGNICPLCSLSIGRVSLKRHMLTEHNLAPYLCTRCDARFSQYEELTSHKMMCWPSKISSRTPQPQPQKLPITKEEEFLCNICSHSLCNEATLFSHMNSFHTPPLTSLTCSLCSAAFIRRSHLASHFKIHKSVMKCATCGTQCYSPEQLTQHASCCGHSSQESGRVCPEQKPDSESDLT